VNLASLWCLDPSVTFLNHGSFGACPSAVLEVQTSLRMEMEREPVDFLVEVLPSRLDAAPEALAAFLGAAGDGGFSMRGYPLLPALYMVCLLGAAARVFTLEPRLALAGIVMLATGWPLYRLGHRLFGGAHAP
jgi:hypothetical protein